MTDAEKLLVERRRRGLAGWEPRCTVKNDSQPSGHRVGPRASLTPDTDRPLATNTPGAVALMYLRADQVISVLPVSRRTLSNWQARRLIKFYKVGRTVLFKRTDIEDALEKFAISPIGTPRPRHRHVEDGNITSEPARPHKRRAVRIFAPANSEGSEP